MASNKLVKMDCECCTDSKDVMCSEHFGMWMCAICVDKQDTCKTLVETAIKIDTTIELKADIFNAGTVEAMQVRAAIWANDDIPEQL